MAADWMDLAACAHDDPDRWFPDARALHAQAQLRAVCAGCPVLADCRTWAVAEIEFGFAGGLTEGERQTLRERQEVAV